MSVDAAIAAGEGCIACLSTLNVKLNLQLKFSTCCGAPYCAECITGKTRGKAWKCARCNTYLSGKDFRTETWDQQKYNREGNMRLKVNKIFNSRRQDFGPDGDEKALKAYNDYIEKAEDFVYDLTWGTAADVDRASRELDRYEQTHRAEIERNYARAAEDARRENAKLFALRNPNASAAAIAAAAAAMTDVKPAIAAAAPAPFVGPQPKHKPGQKPGAAGGGGVKMEVDAKSDAKTETAVERSKRLAAEKEKKQRIKLAGGYQPNYDILRCRQESIDALLLTL